MNDAKEKTKKPSTRAQSHEEMLKEAQSRPGVREMMEVYDHWQKADKGMDDYRAATKKRIIATTTTHTNVR